MLPYPFPECHNTSTGTRYVSVNWKHTRMPSSADPVDESDDKSAAWDAFTRASERAKSKFLSLKRDIKKPNRLALPFSTPKSPSKKSPGESNASGSQYSDDVPPSARTAYGSLELATSPASEEDQRCIDALEASLRQVEFALGGDESRNPRSLANPVHGTGGGWPVSRPADKQHEEGRGLKRDLQNFQAQRRQYNRPEALPTVPQYADFTDFASNAPTPGDESHMTDSTSSVYASPTQQDFDKVDKNNIMLSPHITAFDSARLSRNMTPSGWYDHIALHNEWDAELPEQLRVGPYEQALLNADPNGYLRDSNSSRRGIAPPAQGQTKCGIAIDTPRHKKPYHEPPPVAPQSASWPQAPANIGPLSPRRPAGRRSDGNAHPPPRVSSLPPSRRSERAGTGAARALSPQKMNASRTCSPLSDTLSRGPAEGLTPAIARQAQHLGFNVAPRLEAAKTEPKVVRGEDGRFVVIGRPKLPTEVEDKALLPRNYRKYGLEFCGWV